MEEKIGNFKINEVHNIEALEGLKKLPDNSIDLMVASPPYDKMRDYNGF